MAADQPDVEDDPVTENLHEELCMTESLSSLLDDIFSEVEETCATPQPRHEDLLERAATSADTAETSGDSFPPQTATDEPIYDDVMRSPKQALMEELKHVLRKRNSLELLRGKITAMGLGWTTERTRLHPACF